MANDKHNELYFKVLMLTQKCPEGQMMTRGVHHIYLKGGGGKIITTKDENFEISCMFLNVLCVFFKKL